MRHFAAVQRTGGQTQRVAAGSGKKIHTTAHRRNLASTASHQHSGHPRHNSKNETSTVSNAHATHHTVADAPTAHVEDSTGPSTLVAEPVTRNGLRACSQSSRGNNNPKTYGAQQHKSAEQIAKAEEERLEERATCKHEEALLGRAPLEPPAYWSQPSKAGAVDRMQVPILPRGGKVDTRNP